MLFNRQGGADSFWTANSYPPAAVDPGLRLAFFQAAAGVLLRPQPPPGQEQGAAGLAGKYMVVRRLLPLFDQHAPAEIAAAVRGQSELLGSLVGDDLRQGDSEWLHKGLRPETPPA